MGKEFRPMRNQYRGHPDWYRTGSDLAAPMFEVVAAFDVYIIPDNIVLGEN